MTPEDEMLELAMDLSKVILPCEQKTHIKRQFCTNLLQTQLYHYCVIDEAEYSDEIFSLFFNDINILVSR